MKQNTLLRRPLPATLVCIALLLTTTASAGDAEKGAALFKKSQCLKCHSTEVFTRDDRKVNSLEALEKQVRMCDSQLSVNWFDDEIAHVVAYLNDNYYKFPEDQGDKGKDK